MTVRAEVSKHERDGLPFDTSGRTEFWMQLAETMIMAEKIKSALSRSQRLKYRIGGIGVETDLEFCEQFTGH